MEQEGVPAHGSTYCTCPVEVEGGIAGKSRTKTWSGRPLVEGRRRWSVEKSHLEIDFAGHLQINLQGLTALNGSCLVS